MRASVFEMGSNKFDDAGENLANCKTPFSFYSQINSLEF